MRYYVTLDPPSSEPVSADKANAEPVEVDVSELPSGELRVLVAGQPVAVDVATMPGREEGGSTLSVSVDGQLVDLTTEGNAPDLGIVASGHRSYVRVLSERQRAADAAKKGSARASEKVVKSPMPGRIVKVLVQKGDEVEPGQPLLIIEAMKMENELRAKAKGTVAEVHANPGSAVEAGAKLVTFA